MMNPVRRVLFLVLALLPTFAVADAASKVPAPPANSAASAPTAKLPLAFEPNRGQAPKGMQFVARTPQANLYLSGADAYLQTVQFRRGSHPTEASVAGVQTVRMHLDGANASAPAATSEDLPGVANYLNSNDRSRWTRAVPTFGRVTYAGVYPGVDLTYYGTDGKLEYDFVLASGADPARIKLTFEGGQPRLDSGELVLDNGPRQFKFHAPVSYQTIAGQRRIVEGAYSLNAKGELTFRLGNYDHSQPLVIDPQLVYQAEIGTGGNYNITNKIVVDSAGALYLVGTAMSPNYPVTPGAYQTICGPAEGSAASNGVVYCPANGNASTAAYVSKISADGSTLVYSTYISGHMGYEQGGALAVDSSGVAYILGETASNDFPITDNAFQATCLPSEPGGGGTPTSQCDNFADGGGTEYTINGPVLFFAKLSADGSQLLYSSFLGGSFPVYGYDTQLDNEGNWYLFGQTLLDNTSDLYGSGGAHVQYTGLTSSGYQIVYPGNSGVENDGVFVSKFNNAGTVLEYGTFYGDIVDGITVQPQAFAVGQNGIVYVAGYTTAVNLPTTNGALQPSCTPNSNDARQCYKYYDFLAEFDTTKANAASLVAGTYIGGTTAQGSNIPNDDIYSMKTDAANDIYFTGYSYDLDFPTTSGTYSAACPNPRNGACAAVPVVKMPSGLAKETWGTWVGNTNGYYAMTGNSLGLDSAGNVIVMGSGTVNTGFPCINCFPQYTNTSVLFFELSPDGSNLLWATFFGNQADNTGLDTSQLFRLAISSNDNVYWFGSTNDSLSGATPGAYQTESPNATSSHTLFGEISNPLLANSTVTLTPAAGTIQTGGTISVTVKVAGSSGTPTGTVSLYLDGVFVTTLTLSNGSATFSGPLTGVAKGAHKFGAVYNGNSTYGSSLAIGNLTVTPYATSTTLTANPTSTYVGGSVTLTATVKRTSTSGIPTGTVTFSASGTVFDTVTVNSSGVATLEALTGNLPAGTYHITATYNGDSVDGASASPAVTVTLVAKNATTTNLSASPNPVMPPATETLTATVARKAGGATPTGTVQFYAGSTYIGVATLSNGTAVLSHSTAGLGAGTYPVTATYEGDSADATSTSSAVDVVVQ